MSFTAIQNQNILEANNEVCQQVHNKLEKKQVPLYLLKLWGLNIWLV